MTSIVHRGLLAGAAGTAVLNAITYTDMAVRGRDSSAVPEQTVERLSDALDLQVPGSRHERSNRVTALGALSGTATGLAVGVAGALIRSAGLRLPAALEAVVIGAGAMAATDGVTAALGVTDPTTWTAQDWISDAVPHLGYGAAAVAVLRATSDGHVDGEQVRPASVGLVLRSALLGVATGCRSSLGVAVPVMRSGASGLARLTAAATVTAELVADKLPSTPPRIAAPGAAPRFAAAVTSATTLARGRHRNAVLPALAGAGGAVVGTWAGYAWREWAATRLPDWQAAVAEDVFAVVLAFAASAPEVPGVSGLSVASGTRGY